MAPIVDGMVADAAEAADAALDELSSMVNDSLSGIFMQKVKNFNAVLAKSQFNGKPLGKTLSLNKIALKPKALFRDSYPAYDFDNEHMLDNGCWDSMMLWTTDKEFCGDNAKSWCIEG